MALCSRSPSGPRPVRPSQLRPARHVRQAACRLPGRCVINQRPASETYVVSEAVKTLAINLLIFVDNS
ncbi:hypothetical protein E2C01_013671 [Portunus trituberculatus]|uniref:Uncharacterized protein n=1 Tax=Portunus trituberculatus TaxID=210409 RepID=A0A5B7DHZ1_PORTR|nr:hypothetical protein [Portunus trituberculatus]